MAFPNRVTKQSIDSFIEMISGKIHSIRKKIDDVSIIAQSQVMADYIALRYTP